MVWKCPPLNLFNWSNFWKWKDDMEPAMRNAEATHVDFGFLRGMIESNPHFMPSNIDMIMERKGKFLFGEWKREGEDMKTGQKILLKALAKKHTVLLITGYVTTDAHISLVQLLDNRGMLIKLGTDKATLVKFLQDWYNAVEQGMDI